MTDVEPDPYHELRETDRDHLLAAAWYAADHDTLPTQETLRDVHATLVGDRPHHQTTNGALDRLADRGLVERVDGDPDPRARGVRVTPAGYRTLSRGAARLDAAASVGAES